MKYLLPLAILISLTGCTSVNQTGTLETSGDGSKQVIESNSQWRAKLHISDMKAGHAGNLLKAQARIKNISSKTLHFTYKFKWLDKDDFEVAVDGRPWIPMAITGYESKTVQDLAPNPTVTSFKILVQD